MTSFFPVRNHLLRKMVNKVPNTSNFKITLEELIIDVPINETISIDTPEVQISKKGLSEAFEYLAEEYRKLLEVANGISKIKQKTKIEEDEIKQAINIIQEGYRKFLPEIDPWE